MLILPLLLSCATLAPGAFQVNLPESPDPSAEFVYPWKKGLNNRTGRVEDVLRVGDVIFVGGDFRSVRNPDGTRKDRAYLAALDAATGQFLPFSPELNGRVNCLAASPDGATIFAGGEFSKVNGKGYGKVVAFRTNSVNTASGRFASEFADPRVKGGHVKSLAATRTAVFVGGAFDEAGGSRRTRLAKWALSGGKYVLDRKWTPTASDDVRTMKWDVANNRILAGGNFRKIAGTSRNYLAPLDPTTGKALPWRDQPHAVAIDLDFWGNRLFAALGGSGGKAMAFDLDTGRMRWFYKTDGDVQAVTAMKDWVIFGFHGRHVAKRPNDERASNGIHRAKAFMCDKDSGTLLNWNPNFGRIDNTYSGLGIWALESHGDTLYAGGDFTEVDKKEQQRYAVFGSAPAGTPAPKDLAAKAVSSSAIRLTWTDASRNEAGFRIQRKRGANGDFVGIATVGENVESFRDPGLDADTVYSYRVRALHPAGDSDWSEVGKARTEVATPAAPEDLVAEAVSSSAIRLTWTDASDNERAFRIQRKAEGESDWTYIATLDPDTTRYRDSGLQSDTRYRYRLKARNEAGSSDWVDVQARTPGQ